MEEELKSKRSLAVLIKDWISESKRKAVFYKYVRRLARAAPDRYGYEKNFGLHFAMDYNNSPNDYGFYCRWSIDIENGDFGCHFEYRGNEKFNKTSPAAKGRPSYSPFIPMASGVKLPFPEKAKLITEKYADNFEILTCGISYGALYFGFSSYPNSETPARKNSAKDIETLLIAGLKELRSPAVSKIIEEIIGLS